MSYQQVTPIEMLPELEDLERGNSGGSSPYNSAMHGGSSYTTNANYLGQSMIPPAEAEKVGRFIRGGHSAPVEAGMIPYNEAPPSVTPQIHSVENMMVNSENTGEFPKNNNIKSFNMPDNSPSCLEVAEHVANCPICSKFYNNDKTIYIVAIIVLSIVCLILLKRVLNC